MTGVIIIIIMIIIIIIIIITIIIITITIIIFIIYYYYYYYYYHYLFIDELKKYFFAKHIKMVNLTTHELRLIAGRRGIKNYKNMSR